MYAYQFENILTKKVVFIRTPVKRYSIPYCDSYGKPTPLPRTGLTSADSEKI